MRLVDGRLLLATSDLTTFVRCDHATFLAHGTKTGTVTPLATRPPSRWTELIAAKGNEHERAYVDALRAAGKSVVVIPRPGWFPSELRREERATLEAMHSGADFVVQAAFFDEPWVGFADLLRRVETPSPVLGAWSYEVIDTKLARSVKAHFLLQLSDYSAHLARLQGVLPEQMHVVLGTSALESFPVRDYAAYYRHVRASVQASLARTVAETPYPVEFCALCDWAAHCGTHWRDVDHLSLVANMRRVQAARLENGGVATLAALAGVPEERKIPRLPRASMAVLRHQASMQLEHRRTGVHRFELLPREEKRGFRRLPPPSHGDVFFDVEGDPFAEGGLTFLFGMAWREGGEPRSVPRWAHDRDEEARVFAEVIDFLTTRCAADANAHVYHYGALDLATLRRLAGQTGTREDELDDLLRREVFVDLASIVRQSMRISHDSYGLKKVETFYFPRQETAVAEAGGAVLAYEAFLATRDEAILDIIARYNAEDCFSLLHMQRWLEELRPADGAWVPPALTAPTEQREQEDAETTALCARLTEPMPLLAHLLQYHRRDERPDWWMYYARRAMTAEELFDDTESIAVLQRDPAAVPFMDKRSQVLTFTFPPQQHKFAPGDDAFDPRDGEKTGEILAIDDARGELLLRRGPKLVQARDPEAIIAKPEHNSKAPRAALRRFATAFLDEGAERCRYRAGVDILLRRAPRVHRVDAGAALPGLADVVPRLDDSYLFVQGPPGSGKTWNAATLIVALLRAGKRIGVASHSHKAIHNLLDAVEKLAQQEGYWFRGLKKNGGDADQRFESTLPHPMIEAARDNAACADPAIQLVAGTAWLFSDPQLDASLDFLFVDEAGQVSLANAIAMSTSSRNIVLLGDPLQLAQVSRGAHPDNAGCSVLQHLLGSDATVRNDRGVFLEHTRRMHPSVCAFVSEVVYEKRLESDASCARRIVVIDGVDETGLHFLPVAHSGNAQSSDEEAQAIAREIARMMTGEAVTDGVGRRLRPDDFMVVAAYNAQVRHIASALAAAGLQDVPVGTVDKFQGREATVVLFSMATSSGAELPRDIEFLFSRNRLNVAVSRARCVATVVASPRLLDVACRTPAQMKLVDHLCRFVELATDQRREMR